MRPEAIGTSTTEPSAPGVPVPAWAKPTASETQLTPLAAGAPFTTAE